MPKIVDLIEVLEQFAPIAFQESYDNSGLLLGNKDEEIKGVLVSLDVLESTIDEAIKNNCNVIVSHHPILFSGIKKLTGSDYVQKVIIKAIKNDIAIYAAHTNLDNVYNGVNNKICSLLNLKNKKILVPKAQLLSKLVTFCPTKNSDEVKRALFNAGAGNIGNYSNCSFSGEGEGTFKANENAKPYIGNINEVHSENENRIEVVFPSYKVNQVIAALLKTHPYEEVAYDIYALQNKWNEIGSGMIGELETETDEMEILQTIKKVFEAKCLRYTNLKGKKIKKIAVCGGSGSFLLQDAIKAGADLFLTSDFKYHQFFDAENILIIADIGHYESEQFTKQLFAEIINKNFTTFAVRLTEVNTNPINYL